MNRVLQHLFQFLSQFWRWMLSLLRRGRYEREMEEEMRFHLEMQIEQNLSSGMAAEEAHYSARRQFGNQTWLKEVSREMWSLNSIETLIQDLRYGARMLLKNPGFTLLAVLTLALGIGANTAIFSVVNAVLLQPLPFREPERLVMVWRTNTERTMRDAPVSAPNFIDWKQRNEVFEQMAAWRIGNFNLTGDAEPEIAQGAEVTAGFFETLGVGPALGRGFLPHEDQPGAEPVIVLSHSLWQRRFGSEPGIIGKRLIVDARPVTVIGVMPQGFNHPLAYSSEIKLWTILTLNPQANRNNHFYNVVARLRTGVTMEQALFNMDNVSRQMAELYPQTNRHHLAELTPLHEQATGGIREPLLLLFGAIGLVLLIACANVANLLLARAAGRERELAVRTAMGASRGRLLRQLLTESVLLASLGATAGLLIAAWGIDLLSTFSAMEIARLNEVTLDRYALSFASLMALLTGMLCGFAPAWLSSRQSLSASLKEGARQATGGRGNQRLRGGLVVVEIALSLVLLIGAGLLIKSFLKLWTVDPGFNSEGVLTLNLGLPRARYAQPAQWAAFAEQVTEKLKSLPGAQATAVSGFAPMDGNRMARVYAIEGRPEPDLGNTPGVAYFPVSPDYFRALQIPLLSGRAFTARDDSPASAVVIVSQSFADRYFPGEEAIGRRIGMATVRPLVWREIVGVVGDVRQSRLEDGPRPMVYFPFQQYPFPVVTLIARSTGNPLGLAEAMKQAVYAVDKDLAISQLAPLERMVADSIAQRRALMTLLAVFSALALALATIGVYGVMAYSVAQRTHEIGVRMALGAQAGDVLKMILTQGLKLALIGVVIGLATAFSLTRWMESFLFGVRPTDPLTFSLIAVVLLCVSLLACWIPARRATQVDPMVALRVD
jgi:putative ABC transport system permease protein